MQQHPYQQHNQQSDNLYFYQLSKQHQKEVQDRRYFQKVYYSSIVILMALTIYLLMNAPPSVSAEKLFLATLIFWVGCFPGLYYVKDRERPPLPFLPLIGLFYVITFSLPIFLADGVEAYSHQLSDVSNISLLLTLVGLIGMVFFFYISKFYIWKNIKPIQLAQSFSIGKLSVLLWLLLIGHMAYIYLPVLRLIPSIGHLLGPGGLLCYGIFYLIWAEGKLPFMQTALLVCVFVPLEILPAFVSGLLAQPMSMVLFMIFVLWYKHRRIPILLITITLVMFLLFNPVKHQYRSLVWRQGVNSQDNLWEKAQLFTELAIEEYTDESLDSEFMTEEENDAVSRIAHIALFSDVIQKTPAIVPYWNGYTYTAIFTKFIPRIVWPNKPMETIGNQFGHRYLFLDYRDKSTSINLPWLIELYANFGILGVLFGMPFFGFFLAFIEQKFNNKQMNLIEIIIGITVTFTLAYQESNFSLMVGGIFSLTLALCFIFRFFVAHNTQPVK
ncbi:MAG: hypothetical protein Tsb0014_20310 [Pleurocapsa sp.]